MTKYLIAAVLVLAFLIWLGSAAEREEVTPKKEQKEKEAKPAAKKEVPPKQKNPPAKQPATAREKALQRWFGKKNDRGIGEFVASEVGGWYEAGMIESEKVKAEYNAYINAIIQYGKLESDRELIWRKRQRLWNSYKDKWHDCRMMCGGFLTPSCETCERRRPHPNKGRYPDLKELDAKNERLWDEGQNKVEFIMGTKKKVESHLRQNYDVAACLSIKAHKAKEVKLTRKQRKAAKRECKDWRNGKYIERRAK